MFFLPFIKSNKAFDGKWFEDSSQLRLLSYFLLMAGVNSVHKGNTLADMFKNKVL